MIARERRRLVLVSLNRAQMPMALLVRLAHLTCSKLCPKRMVVPGILYVSPIRHPVASGHGRDVAGCFGHGRSRQLWPLLPMLDCQ